MNHQLRINAGLQRVGFFAMMMVVLLHVFTCAWILLTQADSQHNWLLNKIQDLEAKNEFIDIEKDLVKQYFISMYFVMQTITTVGYGDVNPTNSKERVFVISLMLIGVISFSFISGSLSSIIQSYDDQVSAERQTNMRLGKIAKMFRLKQDV